MTKKYLPEGISRQERTNFLNDRMRRQRPAICTQRAKLVTESDQMTQGEPIIVKRAKALCHILEHMRVYILNEELIVGHHASQLRYAPLFPEISSFSEAEIDLCPVRKVDTLGISPKDKAYLLEEIYPYWKGKCQSDLADPYFPDFLRRDMSMENKVFNPVSRTRSGYGHYVPDFPAVLAEGFSGIEQKADEQLERLSDFDPSYARKMHFYQSVILICQGVHTFAGRYAALAQEMARSESNPRRKKELELIAGVCARVPYYPARTFHEALQSYFFTLLIDYIGQNGSAISAGRFDQYMFPYYERDLSQELICREDAMELLEALLVQHLDIIKAGAYESVRNNGGFATTIHMTVSGCGRDGSDATNEMSYMVLEADRNVFNSEPNVGVRVSEDTPDAILDAALGNLACNEGGKYPIFNDRAIIAALEKDGVAHEDAMDYSIVGCVEPTPSGNTMGLTNACFFNVAKCLELALNDGADMRNGDCMGPRTGAPESMNSYEDLWNAFMAQLEHFTRRTILAMNLIIDAIAAYSPHIYCSAITDGCLESGLDSAAGGAKYNYVGIQAVGIADTADSLYVLKKLAFEDKVIDLPRFCEILRDNFKGQEPFRQLCINRVAKYGNDEDAVDEIAARVARSYCEQIRRGTDIRGAKYRAGLYCLSSNTPMGRQTGALPSGRLAGTPLGDGGISPKHGMDTKGPTASVKSAAKIDHSLATNGTNFNQKYLASLMARPENRRNLIHLIRTYFDLGGFQIQFNILSPETLRNAQEHPEAYRSLVVRVAGYSAFFVELDPEIQNEIISRTELTSL